MSQEIIKDGEVALSAVRATSGTSPLPATRKDVASFALEFGKAWEYAPAPETADHVKIEPRYELFIGGKWRAPKSGKYFATISPSTEAEARRRGRRQRRGRGPRREGSPHARTTASGRRCGRASGRSTSSGSRGRCRRRRASWRSSSRWTAASRSKNRATSISRSPRRTSSITQGGPTSSTTPSTDGARGRSASPRRSSRGTSRSSWRRGRSRRRSRAGTPSS